MNGRAVWRYIFGLTSLIGGYALCKRYGHETESAIFWAIAVGAIGFMLGMTFDKRRPPESH